MRNPVAVVMEDLPEAMRGYRAHVVRSHVQEYVTDWRYGDGGQDINLIWDYRTVQGLCGVTRFAAVGMAFTALAVAAKDPDQALTFALMSGMSGFVSGSFCQIARGMKPAVQVAKSVLNLFAAVAALDDDVTQLRECNNRVSEAVEAYKASPHFGGLPVRYGALRAYADKQVRRAHLSVVPK